MESPSQPRSAPLRKNILHRPDANSLPWCRLGAVLPMLAEASSSSPCRGTVESEVGPTRECPFLNRRAQKLPVGPTRECPFLNRRAQKLPVGFRPRERISWARRSHVRSALDLPRPEVS